MEFEPLQGVIAFVLARHDADLARVRPRRHLAQAFEKSLTDFLSPLGLPGLQIRGYRPIGNLKIAERLRHLGPGLALFLAAFGLARRDALLGRQKRLPSHEASEPDQKDSRRDKGKAQPPRASIGSNHASFSPLVPRIV